MSIDPRQADQPEARAAGGLTRFRLRQRRARSFLRALLLGAGLGLCLVLGIWWFVSRNLGRMVSQIVREQAAESLNGKLDFERLDIDLRGQAVLHNLSVTLSGDSEPVISAKRTLVGLNLLNFVGPNRGRRSLAVHLFEPRLRAVREADGSFNLSRLAKPVDPSKPPADIGFAVRIRQGELDFTDKALLSGNLPQISDPGGPLGQFLLEAGYVKDQVAQQGYQPHHEVLSLQGRGAFNPAREEASFDLRLRRAGRGGDITAKGSLKTDGSRFKIEGELRNTDIATLADYRQQVLPKLHIAPGGDETGQPGANPVLRGQLERLKFAIEQEQGKELQLGLDGQLKDFWLRSDSLPEIAMPSMVLKLDPDKELLRARLELDSLGLQARGDAALSLASDELSGSFKLSNIEPAVVLAQLKRPALPLTGKLAADLTLSGKAAQPEVLLKLSSGPLSYQSYRLGKLSGELQLTGQQLTARDIRLTDGELPLLLQGELDLSTENGSLSLSASGIGIRQAADIVARLNASPGQKPLAGMDGKFSLKLDASLAAGQPQLRYRVWSEALQFDGFSLRSPDMSGSWRGSTLSIDSATASLTTKEALKTPLFRSTEPLKLTLRAGGSVSLANPAAPQLKLSGSAESRNLQPAQVQASFKLDGALSDPSIKLQLKGPVDGQPVVLTAAGRYRQTWSDVTAKLNWQQTNISYSGKVHLLGKQLDGKLSAAEVDLGKFSSVAGLSGLASLEAQLQGSFDKLDVSGKLSALAIRYVLAGRTYLISDVSAGFKLVDGQRVSITDGRLLFEGNRVHVDGTLGQAGSDLTLASESFNLLSVLSLAQPASGTALAIDSSGPLVIRLTGTLKDPAAELSYQSGPGSVEGRSFSSASLRATASLRGAELTHFDLRSQQGAVSGSGKAQFEPLRYSGKAQLSGFDVGLLTPLLGAQPLAALRGTLFGGVEFNGGPGQLAAEADLRLEQGSYRGYTIDKATAQLQADSNGMQIRQLEVSSRNTTLTASGSFPRDSSKARFKASAPRLELALLQPLLPKGSPLLAGQVKLELDLRPGRGGLPDADLTINDLGQGIALDGRTISSVAALLELRSDELSVKQLDLGVQNSSLRLSGTARLKDFQAGKSQPFPLNMSLEANNFNLADIAPLLPQAQRKLLPEGVVSVNPLKLTGTTQNPLLTGNISFALSRLPQGLPESITTVAGNLTLAENVFRLVNVDIATAEGKAAGTLGQASITGSGKLALNPPRLVSGAIVIDLAPVASGGRFVKLVQPRLLTEVPESSAGSFDGTLGGLLTFTAANEFDGSPAVLGGRLLITESKGKSVLTLPTPQQSSGGGGAGTRLSKLEISVQEGTEIRYKPGVDLRASISGELTLDGVPGLEAGDPDALSISGHLRLTRGSLQLYRHTVRLDESYESTIRFSGEPGDFVPTLNGRGMLVIPNVLEGGDVITTGTPGAIKPPIPTSGAAAARESRDLRVFFTFKDLKLSPDREGLPEVSLSSDPPRSPEQILRYLAGGVGDLLSGNAELADIAESELIGFGSSWVSRKLEEALGIDALRLGGSPVDDDNPFYIDVEQQLNPQLSVTYFRNFFSQTNQQEELGLKYRPFREQLDNKLQGLQLEVNFQNDNLRGRGSEFMFTWSTRF